MIDEKVLGNFTGTENWHKYSAIMPKVLLTDGALYVANEGGAFWLMDIIGSVQRLPGKRLFNHPFTV